MTAQLTAAPSAPRRPRQLGLRARALLFISLFLALAIGVTVVAMSWNARTIVIEQVERDVEVLSKVLAQSISLSQQLPDQTEDLLGHGMQATATALAHFVEAAEQAGRRPEQIKASLRQIISRSMIAEIWITDSKGRAYLNAPLEGIDFTFNPDPKVQAQASAFWPLLEGQASLINQPMAEREIDGKPFKYVGVPGIDKPRIVQVGTPGESLVALREAVGVQRLTRVLVASGALKAIYVVQQDMSPLAYGHSTQGAQSQLEPAQRQALQEALRGGPARAMVQADHIEVAQAIRDEYDNPLGAFIVQLPKRGLDDLLQEQLLSASLIGLAVFLVGGLVSLSFADRIAKPIGEVTRVASQVRRGDFAALPRLDAAGQRRDEIGELARVFQGMASEVQNRERILDEQVSQRTQELADKNRALSDAQSVINQELDLARRLQLAILPERFPDIAHCQGHAQMRPATQMGGDFYDFIALPDGRVAIVMADVSGKGVTAAFFMAVARTSLNALVRANPDPGHCLARANDELCGQNPLDLFVTVFLGVFDPATGELRYANGGHNPPLLSQSGNDAQWLASTGDMALGVMPGMPYTSASVTLAPGQTLLCYTDGVTEAFNSDQQAYGEERLQQLVLTHASQGPTALVDAVLANVTAFAGQAPQSDDITLAAFSWTPRASDGPLTDLHG